MAYFLLRSGFLARHFQAHLNYGLRWEIYFPESVNAKGNGGFANLVQGQIRVAGHGPYGLNGNIDNA